jgi:hypothetical protein
MAQEFSSAAEWTEDDRRLDSPAFQSKEKGLRDNMKVVTLSLISGVTDSGLARQLEVVAFRAAEMHDRFLAMFPTRKHGLDAAMSSGTLRGYASTSSGIWWYRPKQASQPTNWERSRMTARSRGRPASFSRSPAIASTGFTAALGRGYSSPGLTPPCVRRPWEKEARSAS